MPDPAPHDLVRTTQKFVDLILRYIVSGGALVLTFGALQPQPFLAYRVSGTNELSQWLLLVGIAVGGPAIYSIHRAFLHRLMQGLFFPIARRISHNVFSSFTNVTTVLQEIDKKRAIWRDIHAPWLPLYEEWCAQTHFLYCSCWGIITALAIHLALATPIAERHILVTTGIAIALLLSAVVGDFRVLAHQLVRPTDSRHKADG